MRFFGGHRHLNEDLLNDYVSGRLSPEQRERVEWVAAGCAQCREELQSLEGTRSLLQALPQEQLPRSFVFAQAPESAPAARGGGDYRPVPAWRFRIPGRVYAGAAAVAGVAALVFVLSGAAGTWLPQGGEGEFGTMASSAPMEAAPEMAQAESAPFPPAAREAMEAAPATQAEPAMAQSMAAEQSAASSAPVPVEAPAEDLEADGEARVAGDVGVLREVEVAREAVAEGIMEAQAVTAPTSPPVAAQAPRVAEMMADAAPTTRARPTAPPAAASAPVASSREVQGESPGETGARELHPTVGQAAGETPGPAVLVEGEVLPHLPSGSEPSEAAEAEGTPAPAVRKGELAAPSLVAPPPSVGAPDTANAPKQADATPVSRESVGAATSESTAAFPTSGPTASVVASRATRLPPEPTATTATSAMIEADPRPTEGLGLGLERNGAGPGVSTEEEGPRSASGSTGVPGLADPVGPAGSDGSEGPRGAAGPQGASEVAAPGVPEGAAQVGSLDGSRGVPRDAVEAALEENASPGEVRTWWESSASVVLVGVAIATGFIAAAFIVALRYRTTRRNRGSPGTNQEPDTSTLVNRPKLEN